MINTETQYVYRINHKYILNDLKTANRYIQQKSHQEFHLSPQFVFFMEFPINKEKIHPFS